MTLNYLGKYDNLSLLWEAHPNGGIEGEYCYVGDQLFVWDKYENDWVEGSAEVLDVIPSDQPERESNNGLNYIGSFESEQQLWSQHPQGGVEGDYVVIAGKEYIWDKYNKEWREATEEDAAHFTAVIVQDEAYEYSRLAITFMGSFEDVSQIWKVYPQGGIEGGYIYLGEDKYIWDKYSYSWKPFEPTESSKLRPIDVTYTEGVVAYSEDYINYIGAFDNLDQVWEMYPNGGKDGDYILVNGERLKWNKYTSNWGEDESGDTSPARSVATIYGDLHIFNDLVIGEGLYARILEELSKKQWVQDNFTTKQWLLDQNYARQEWVLDQYEVLQDWVDQRNADIAKWILERNYISEGDISSETVMNLIETDEITITKKDGVLVAIASGGQGSVPIITTEDVDVIPSDQNVFSAAKVAATFLDATKGGTVLEPVNFEKGIRIGGEEGIEIIYDIENNALCFGGNVYSLGGITAGGVGSGGSGGGGGISYNRLDSWADYSADKAGYVLSALLGKDLDSRVSALANAGYVTASALAPYALRSELPIITKDGLKSTLGISDWALAATKPTYTASEVGALSLDGGTVTGEFIVNGQPIVTKAGNATITFSPNNREHNYWFGVDIYGSLFITDNGYTKVRAIIHEDNIGNYKAGDAGNSDKLGWVEASKYFKGDSTDLSSNINADNLLNNACYLNQTGNGSGNENFPHSYSIFNVFTNGSDSRVAQVSISNDGLAIRRKIDSWGEWRHYINTANIGNYNAGSATKLQTPRTIWGQSFDGTGDITGALTAPSITANSLTIGGVTLTYDSGNEALCINGNMYALGGVTAGGAGISAYTSLEARVARIEQQLNIS